MTALHRRHLLTLAALPWLAPTASAAAGGVDDAWTDAARARELPLRGRWPVGNGPCGVILFSHGLGGSREGGDAWGAAWRDAGFLVLHLQHAGSDGQALRGGPLAWRRAVDPQQLRDRVDDVKYVIDELARRGDQSPWSRVRLDAIGMAGHSFGAQTAQALAGQRFAVPTAGITEPRIRAFVALSPSQSRQGQLTAQQQFGDVIRPLLCITGTLDGDPLADLFGSSRVTPQTRREVYDGLPAGRRALLLLDRADHMTFAGNAEQPIRRGGLRDEATLALEPVHHALVARLSTDWWRAQLLDDREADARLARPQGLGPNDLWRRD